MNSQDNILTVHPPIPKKQLGRYRFRKGIYLIRLQEEVIYIGNSSNIYKAALRLFQKSGALSHININKVTFEVILSSLRRPPIGDVLKGEFKPHYNYKSKLVKSYSAYEERQAQRIREAYYRQSRFTPEGEHTTDSKTKPNN
jgi:excinuclease UvrABC nuclease subunit